MASSKYKKVKLPKNKQELKREVFHIFNHLFYEVYSKERYVLDLFRLVLTSEEFDLFDWKTLQSKVTVFVDKVFREQRADVIFSVKMKDSDEIVEIIFLFEHKSYNDSDIFLQLLKYQASIYEKDSKDVKSGKRKAPSIVIPVLVYSGKSAWNLPLSFHDYLNFKSLELKKAFGENVLNYKYRLLNLHDLGMTELSSKDLLSGTILFILKSVWNLDEQVIADLFKLSNKLASKEDRVFLMERAVDCVKLCDPSFTWNILQEIEEKNVSEERRTMPALQMVRDRIRQEARQEGLQEGLQKGLQKGLQEGRQEIILNLLRANMDIEKICELTHLSRQEVLQIQSKCR